MIQPEPLQQNARASFGASDAAQPTPLADALGQEVWRLFTQAKNHRASLIDPLLLDCLRLRVGEYSDEELARLGLTKSYYNIIQMKISAGAAWFNDILSSTEGKPWDLEHTPLVDVPEHLRRQIIDNVRRDVMATGMDRDKIRELATQYRDITRYMLNEAAKKASERMAEKIDDQLKEAGFSAQLTAFVDDFFTFPYAVMKGPIPVMRKVLAWKFGRSAPVVEQRLAMEVKRISPFDIWWTPNVTEYRTFGWVFERDVMFGEQLMDATKLPNYNAEAIREVLETYYDGFRLELPFRTRKEFYETKSQYVPVGTEYDVLKAWGTIDGRTLRSYGVPDIDESEFYNVCVETVAGRTIKAVLNPDQLGRKPYYITCYRKVPGSLVGDCVPTLGRTSQEIVNSSVRALRRNMGLASGPFGEVNVSRLDDGEEPEELEPMMLKGVRDDLTGSNTPAYRFHNIESHAGELNNILNAEMERVGELTGIPRLVHSGQPGGVGRTVGGLAILLSNSAKSLRDGILHIETDVLAPLIEAYFTYNMLSSDDETIKADAQVIAHGLTGVLMKEAAVQRQIDFLQVITPYLATGAVSPEGIKYLLRGVGKGVALPDLDKVIPDPDMQRKMAELAQSAGGIPPGGPPGASPGLAVQPPGAVPPGMIPGPGLPPQLPGEGQAAPLPDARSGLAAGAIQQSNSL